MKVKKRLALCVALISALLLWATPALAVPPLPHAFYGTVLINGVNGPAGTVISAKINEVNAGSYTITNAGHYGDVATHDYLAVSCEGANDGDTITFHATNANGTAIAGTAIFEVGGGPTSYDISVNIVAPVPSSGGGGGGGGAGTTQLVTNLFGSVGTFTIDSHGIIQNLIKATSADGKLTITIPIGTKALDKDGNPLASMTTIIDPNPPAPPENANVIGLAYNFGPAGATFDPPITFEWKYNVPLPAGMTEADLDIAYYDTTTGHWVELHGVVNSTTHTITALVSHFTTFAIIGTLKPAAFTLSSLVISPAQVAPGDKVNINLSVANTGGIAGSYTVVLNINGVKEAEKSVTVPAGSSQTVSFSVTKANAGSYSVTVGGLSGSFTVAAAPVVAPPTTAPPATTPPVIAPTTTAPPTTTLSPAPPPPPKPSNHWPLIGGIIGGVVIIVLVILLVSRRRD